MTAITKPQPQSLRQSTEFTREDRPMKTTGIMKWVGAGILCLGTLGGARPAHAGPDIDCRMHFQLSGWSAFYKTATGSGKITCNNGQSMHVHIRAEGGGLTFGKTEIDDGRGSFTGVYSIREVLGHYASAEAHAGAQVSADSQVLTKGNVSLALSGKGRGWNIGIAFGAFIIEP
jgi:hypothetical protein